MRIRGDGASFSGELQAGLLDVHAGQPTERQQHSAMLLAECLHTEATSTGHAHLVISDDLATLCGAEIAGVVAGSGAPRCRRCEVMAHALGEGSAN
jgi:hypothetical protein